MFVRACVRACLRVCVCVCRSTYLSRGKALRQEKRTKSSLFCTAAPLFRGFRSRVRADRSTSLNRGGPQHLRAVCLFTWRQTALGPFHSSFSCPHILLGRGTPQHLDVRRPLAPLYQSSQSLRAPQYLHVRQPPALPPRRQHKGVRLCRAVCVCVCVCARARVCLCVRARVCVGARACARVRACMRACVRACEQKR